MDALPVGVEGHALESGEECIVAREVDGDGAEAPGLVGLRGAGAEVELFVLGEGVVLLWGDGGEGAVVDEEPGASVVAVESGVEVALVEHADLEAVESGVVEEGEGGSGEGGEGDGDMVPGLSGGGLAGDGGEDGLAEPEEVGGAVVGAGDGDEGAFDDGFGRFEVEVEARVGGEGAVEFEPGGVEQLVLVLDVESDGEVAAGVDVLEEDGGGEWGGGGEGVDVWALVAVAGDEVAMPGVGRVGGGRLVAGGHGGLCGEPFGEGAEWASGWGGTLAMRV